MCMSLPGPLGNGLVESVIACASVPGSPEGDGTGTMNCRNVSLQPTATNIRMLRLASSHIVLKLTFIQTPPVLPVERQTSELLRGFYCKPLVMSLCSKPLESVALGGQFSALEAGRSARKPASRRPANCAGMKGISPHRGPDQPITGSRAITRSFRPLASAASSFPQPTSASLSPQPLILFEQPPRVAGLSSSLPSGPGFA